jgi:hypothetical protein
MKEIVFHQGQRGRKLLNGLGLLQLILLQYIQRVLCAHHLLIYHQTHLTSIRAK